MSVSSTEQVRGLAPDQASVLAAERLARAGRWLELGRSERALWGSCRGSARAPYETVVALGPDLGWTCTCPSRKRPCKHVLAVLLLAGDDAVSTTPEPERVTRWLERRVQAAERAAGRASARAERGGAPADPEAAARRVAARRERVSAGLEELDRWLGDQVRTGLAGLPRAGYAHFDAIAARMVDAQAPGVAGMLRGIPADLVGENWPERALHAFGGLHLLVRAHRALDRLPDDLAATVRSRVGYPVGREEVLATPGVRDDWLALGSVDTVEYQLESRRVWLLGATTGRWALWLTFAAPGQQFDTSVLPGQVVAGALHFYPGSGQYRALVGERHDPGSAAPETRAGGTLAETRARFAGLLGADPWASRMPVLLRGVPIPARPTDPWRLRDEAGETCPLDGADGEWWPLLARSGGEPITLFGEWHSGTLLPLSVLQAAGGAFTTAVAA